jgi:type I restriction enzyme S subunit
MTTATSTPLSTGLKPYSEYKDSGLPWLGRVPGHWGMRRAKVLLCERVEKGFPDEPLLAATQSKGVVRKEDYGTRTVTAQKDFHLLKLVEVGDFVISLRSFEGGIEVAYSRGIISPAYTVLEPRSKATSGYLRHFFKSPTFISSLKLFVTGIREGQNIDYERLSRAFLPLPPDEEQAAIVRFLNHATHRLDKAIRAKRKTIALLNEQKQVIIHRAVTRGIDPDVPLKDSGIPWLGDIPVGWETIPIKRIASVLNGFAFSSEIYADSGIPLVRIGDVKSSGAVDIEHAAKLPENYLTSHSFVRIKNGDLVMAMTGATIGKVAIYLHDHPALLNQRVCAFRCRIGRVKQDYLFLLLSSKLYLQQVLMACYGGAQPNISDKSLAGFKMPVAPFDLQDRIVSFVAVETKSLNAAILRFEREIDLLREYRTRLIADVVTGKLDVLEAAARLPDEALSDKPVLAALKETDDELAEEEV